MRKTRAAWIFALLSLLVWSKNVVGQEESPCIRYAELHSEMKCEPGNFLIEFGFRYCHRFEYKLSTFSEESQLKLTQIKLCLIQSLNLESGLTCENVRERSLTHHVDCYLKHGFCQMPMDDRIKLYAIVLKELIAPDMMETGNAIRQACGFVLFNKVGLGSSETY